MLGRRVDRAAGFILGHAALYLLFLRLSHGIPLACLLTAAASLALRRIFRRRPRSRCTRAQAEAELLRVACLPEDAAEAALRALLKDDISGPGAFLALPRYPESTLSASEVFGLWREHRGEEALWIAATCAAGEDARHCAAALSRPAVRLLDRAALVRRLRRREAPPSPRVPLAERLRRLGARFCGTPITLKRVLTALSLLAVYRYTGRPWALVTALLWLFQMGASLIHRYA